MLIEKVGAVSAQIELLGAAEVPVYLAKGEDWALIDAGVSPVIPALFEQLQSRPEISRLKYLVLTHSHFDHAGGLDYILARFPAIKVVASRVTREVFAKPAAAKYITGMNDALAKFAGIDFAQLGLGRSELRVDELVDDGGRIELGAGVSLEVYSAPGHSRCSLAYVLNPERALFSGEAIGFYNSKDQILPEALSSFKDYIATLEKLSRIPLEMICLPHGGVLTGEQVRTYFPLALEWAEKFKSEFARRLQSGANDGQILEQMTGQYYQGKIKLQPEAVFRGNLSAMLNAVKKEN